MFFRLLFWNPVMFFGRISVCFLGFFFGTRLCFSDTFRFAFSVSFLEPGYVFRDAFRFAFSASFLEPGYVFRNTCIFFGMYVERVMFSNTICSF
jgi:hypothetical protein